MGKHWRGRGVFPLVNPIEEEELKETTLSQEVVPPNVIDIKSWEKIQRLLDHSSKLTVGQINELYRLLAVLRKGRSICSSIVDEIAKKCGF